jgi:G3E family GTPase
MTALYLITGFLGAGKTTFLKEFSRLFPEQKLAVLVNEFGKTGVDGALLSDLRAAVTEVTGGSIFCTCKLDTFESELTALLSHGPDVVLVEASGLSDPTAIWKLLDTRPCFSEVDYRGCICLCDARSFPKVLTTARPCRKQLSVCDVLALSKTDVATAEERQAALDAIHALRPDVTVVETIMGVIPPEYRESFLHPLRTARAMDVAPLTADLTLRSLLLEIDSKAKPASVEKFLQMFCEDTCRVKGFLTLDGRAYLADCVGAWISLQPTEAPAEIHNQLVVLYTSSQPAAKSLQTAMEWYPGLARRL